MAKVVKRTFSLDPEVLAATEAAAAGPPYNGNVSRLVNESLEKHVKLRGLREWLDEMEREFGPVSERDMEEVRRLWPD